MKIYNTQSRTKEEFTPVEPGKVKLYACGPTVYNYFHIGNARTFLFFDVVRRYFEYAGYDVTFVQNITDIDDKIINQAIAENIPFEKVAEHYTKAFFEDTGRLGLRPTDHSPKATEYIGKMIGFIRDLEKKGFAYEADGDVYFSVDQLDNYGSLSGKKTDEQLVGARIQENKQKRNPLDFTLWKKSKPGEPTWNSPWGEGRPGWHTECVVMSRDLLGETFDIHGGAVDLVFPHHENEQAQAYAQNGKPLARYWMHGGFLNMAGEKMSKSLGNFFTTRDVLDKFDPEVVRLFFLSKHYRSPIDYSPDLLEESKSGVANFYDALEFVDFLKIMDEKPQFDEKVQAYIDDFKAAMDDDFNTAKAVALLFDLARNIKNLSEPVEERIQYAHALVEIGSVLGFFSNLEDKLRKDDLSGKLVEMFIEYRQLFKKEKNYTMADKIRNDLADIGIELLDTKDGTIWKSKRK